MKLSCITGLLLLHLSVSDAFYLERIIRQNLNLPRLVESTVQHASPQKATNVEESRDVFEISEPSVTHSTSQFTAHSPDDLMDGLTKAGISLSVSKLVAELSSKAFSSDAVDMVFIMPKSGDASLSVGRVSTQRHQTDGINVHVAVVCAHVDVTSNRQVSMREVVKHLGNSRERKWVEVQERGITTEETSTVYGVLMNEIQRYSESNILKLEDEWYEQHRAYEGEVITEA